jgi:uroporphyrinogen-III synthase
VSRDRVLLPRPEGRGDDLSDLLEIAGYDVVRAPFVRIEPAPAAELAPALERLAGGEYDLLVITSPATVRALVDAEAQSAGRGRSAADAEVLAEAPAIRVPASTEIIAVGGATTRALHEAGLEVGMVAEGSGAALVGALRRRQQEDEAAGPAGASTTAAPAAPSAPGPAPRVLLPASSAAAPTVREGLENAGMRVDQVDAYHPRHADLPEQVERDLPAGGFDAIVLTSSMIARRAAELGVHPRTAVVVIGRPTQEAAEQAGLRVDTRAEHPDAPSLARAVHLALAPETTVPAGRADHAGPSGATGTTGTTGATATDYPTGSTSRARPAAPKE